LKLIKGTLLFLLFLVSAIIEAQELPPIDNYTPEFYKAENQNWSISQSNENYIYVANNSGLLEFNGSKWKLYPSPNGTILRSVKVVNERIYTGSHMEFGYWLKTEFGNLEYTTLTNKMSRPLIEDEQFWNIVNIDNWVIFQSLNRLIIYDTANDSFKTVESKSNLTKVFKVGNTVYFQKINDGIYKIENGSPILISNNLVLQKNIVVNISKINEKIIFQTQEKGFYFILNNKLQKWKIKADAILSKSSIYSSLQLKDGSLVIGTISNGIYHLNDKGEILLNINHEKGLNNNTVLALFEDNENNLWLGLDNGISVINFNAPYKVYHDIKGKLGTIYTSALYNNNLYLGTNQGLFYKNLDSQNDFKFVSGTKGQVWSLKVIDNTLFCGHNIGTFVIQNDRAKLISNVMGAWNFKPIKKNSNLILQGNYNGLYILEKNKNNWHLKNKLEGFDISSKFFEFSKDNTVFVSHEYKGVFKLKVSDDYKIVKKYSLASSAPKGLKSSLVNYNNELLYTSNRGIFKYTNKNNKFEKDTVLSNNFLKNETYLSGKLIVEPQSNTLWGFTTKNIIYFSPGKLNNIPIKAKLSFPESYRKVITGYESVAHLKDQMYLIGTSSGYVILDLNKLKTLNYNVEINSVEKSILDKVKTSITLKSTPILKFKENNLYLDFSVAEFDKFTAVVYQYQLKGLYNEWSNWSSTSNVSFKNLPFGDYVFNVKAKIGNNISTNTASFSFTIKRPWVLSNQMLAIYFALLIVLLYLIHSFYKRYYTKQKLKLLEKKQRELTLARLENEQQVMKVKNSQLISDIESKNRELTITTMSIIKKNEILNTIKKELMLSQQGEATKKVIKTIDKNINNKKDWEFLEEAFNNADKDFLKKVKNLHPDLTPNDLRFCAYLRLNLSSKEIAPLINISVRSVEIKRYRLRKKMNLDHEKSLVDYILTI
jgi:AraC family transcriptional regulator, chitin signaling transcriptional activator